MHASSAGRKGRGPHSGPWNTVWGLQTDKGRALPVPCPQNLQDRRRYGCGAYGPLLNLVGANVQGDIPSGWWVENMPPGQLVPQDMYTAQVKARLGKVLYTAPMPSFPSGSRRAGIRASAAPVRVSPATSRRSPAPSRGVVQSDRSRRAASVALLIDMMMEEFGGRRGFADASTLYEDHD
jgi:hypothetical protein